MSFNVVVEPSGHRFVVEAGETILDAALRQGLSLPYGCRNGVCGSCKGKVVEGEIDYADGPPAAISEAEAVVGQALLCRARPRTDLTLEARELHVGDEAPVRRYPARVVRLERLAPDVMRVYLKLPETDRMQFLAGQYIDILLPDGRRRSFSLANAPHDDALLELHIRHVEGGDFTGRVFSSLHEKDILRIEGPFGQFCLREESPRPMLFVAGGTGFAPIKGIIEHALQEGVSRPIHLYWGVRNREDLYLDTLASAWRARGIHYTPVLSAAAADWDGRIGYAHDAVLHDHADITGFDVYVAGPPAMVKAAHVAFGVNGLPETQFFSDPFEFQGPAKK